MGVDLLAAYRGCRFLVHLPFEETLGLVPLEAMAAAKPVIASNAGGLSETVLPGQTGFLVTTQAAFQEAATQLIASDDACRVLGGAARRHVQPFTWERTANQIEGICAILAQR
jgi:glycosyltransferase involved in cell wall biosynthesis